MGLEINKPSLKKEMVPQQEGIGVRSPNKGHLTLPLGTEGNITGSIEDLMYDPNTVKAVLGLYGGFYPKVGVDPESIENNLSRIKERMSTYQAILLNSQTAEDSGRSAQRKQRRILENTEEELANIIKSAALLHEHNTEKVSHNPRPQERTDNNYSFPSLYPSES